MFIMSSVLDRSHRKSSKHCVSLISQSRSRYARSSTKEQASPVSLQEAEILGKRSYRHNAVDTTELSTTLETDVIHAEGARRMVVPARWRSVSGALFGPDNRYHTIKYQPALAIPSYPRVRSPLTEVALSYSAQAGPSSYSEYQA
jgi:hypothetical protein